MSRELATNGDFVQPVVEAAKAHVTAIREWAREHPDEACVAVAPALAVVLSTRRHQLSFPEALLLSELGYWCGVLALREYRRWKSQPAGRPRLEKVV